MGWFERWRKPEIRADTGEVVIDDPVLRALLGGGEVTREMAMQVPTVAGGIDLIAGIVAGTPIRLYRDTPGKKADEVLDDPRLRLLNDETGDTLDANQFWRAMVRDYYLGKGGYAYIHRSRGKWKSLHYVEESRVSVYKNSDPIFKDYTLGVNGTSYQPFDFLKILRNTANGAQGVPITVESGKLIETAYNTLVLEGTLVKKGGNKRGFLKAKSRLTQEKMDMLRAAFRDLYSNDVENVVVLNEGLEFQESSNTAVEMQLNENKTANAAEFAKIFHVSPDAMTGKADDTASLAKLAAIPLMKTIECALNRDFLLEKEKGLFYWAFDTKELLACVRAITRTQAEVDTKLSAGNITLDRSTFELASPTGSFRLANKEFQMMELLMANPHHIISAERFLEKIWGFDNEAEINVVWVYISYLRKKLAALHADITIKSSRNAGYSLEEEV